MPKGELRTTIVPASVEAPRNVEAAILPFQDGRLYLVYSAGERADHVDGGMPSGEIRLKGRWSYDEGDSWSEPFLVREMPGVPNVMEPSFLHLRDHRVLQVYMQRDTYVPNGNPNANMLPMMTFSDNDCANWSEPESITGGETVFFTTNDRLISLQTGRILLPVLTFPCMSVRVWLSDDNAKTWRKNEEVVQPPENTRFGYPIATELADGTVTLFLLNSTGRIHVSHSQDGGETWSPVSDSGPEPCPATFNVRRIPDSPDLLMIWNNHTQRTNLTSAISHDNGHTWSHYRLLESQTGWPVPQRFAFPSIAFLNDCAHMTWYECRPDAETGARFELIYRRLPITWFYSQ